MRSKRTISHFSSGSEESLVNLTPLIDVVFVVLITFILIAPLLELDRVHLAPKTKSGLSQESFQNSSVNIYVHEDNSIWINKQKISSEELKAKLGEVYLIYPKAIPQLFHDRKAYFGTYQKVKDAVETVGFEQLDVILKSE